jgi:hypothetical protein
LLTGRTKDCIAINMLPGIVEGLLRRRSHPVVLGRQHRQQAKRAGRRGLGFQAQLAQGETDVIVQPGEDFRIKLGDGAVIELLVEQLQAPHDSRGAANEQALGESRLTAKIRKQLALASLQKTPRSRTPVNGVTKDPALKRPTVGALAAFRCWRYCLGSHTVLLTYLRPCYKSCCVINLATTERNLAQVDTTFAGAAFPNRARGPDDWGANRVLLTAWLLNSLTTRAKFGSTG